jgi:hypothetical protein
MDRLDLDHWYTFGRVMAYLDEIFGVTPCDISTRDWSRINTAAKWLENIVKGTYAIIPGSERAAEDLLRTLVGLQADNPNRQNVRVDTTTAAQVNVQINHFHAVIRSNAQQIYVFFHLEEGPILQALSWTMREFTYLIRR